MRFWRCRWAVRAGRGALVAFLALALGACGGGAEREAAGSPGAGPADSSNPQSNESPGLTPALSGETATLPRSAPDAQGRFRLAGNEPFWGVTISAQGIRYSTPDYRDGILFPSVAPEVVGDTLRWVAITARPEAHTLEVTLESSSCQDGMSDRTWSHTARVVFDGTTLTGCGERAAAASR